MPRTVPAALLIALTIAFATTAFAADHHSRVRVHLDSPAAQEYLQRHQAQLDILHVKPGQIAEIAVLPAQLADLRAAGLSLDVLESNMELAARISDKAVGFGAFHTYSENTAFVDSLRQLYPEVISAKWSLGQSHLGNDIWCFRVSDNPDLDENEPEILIDGMHHAREIMASEFPILFAEYLAQNYGTDPEITWLLDHRELYIVPIVNPDGVLYNEATNPGGGGMWRKNRRDNGDGSFGVDPNRNYPYQWAYDNSGSSPIPSDITYRGPSAGSEPEVQALMGLIASHDFVSENSVHSYSNLTLYPWGYVNLATPDGTTFEAMGAEMCKYNGYFWGTPVEAINYAVNGGTIDWSYGQHGVLAFSNEIGGSNDGFWPSESRRIPLFVENIWPNIFLMRSAGAFLEARDAATTPVAKAIGPGQEGFLDFTIENQGATVTAPAATITLRSDDAWLQLHEAQRAISPLGPLSSADLSGQPIPFAVETGCPNGHYALVDVELPLPEGSLHSPLSILVGNPAPLLAEDFEGGADDWTFTGNWAVSTEAAYSGSYGITDSPGGEYGDNSATTATLNPALKATRITFRHKYSIEDGWDYGRVQVSADGGPWSTIYSCTGIHGAWELVSLDLSLYAGQDLQFRFLLESDGWVRDDGWWIDDIQIEGFDSNNLPPTTPAVAIPSSLPTGGATPTVAVLNSTDPEGQSLTYGFRVYSDELCTQPLFQQDGIIEGASATEYTISGLADGDYWWRAWAFDGEQRSLLTPPTPVTVNDTSPVGGGIALTPGLRVLGSVTGRQARLQMNLPHAADVTIDVFDARGARVRNLRSGSMEAGTRTLVWDGRDSAGRDVSSGVYLVRMLYGHETFTGRVVMVR